MDTVIHHIFNPGLLIVLLVLIALIFFEKFLPRHQNTFGSSSRRASNVWLGICYRIIFSPLVIAPLVLYITKDSPYKWQRPGWYGGIPGFVADVIFLDLLNYSLHVMAHHVPLLWRFHAIHHLDTHLDSTTGLRQHFGEKFLALAIRLPVMFLIAVPYQTVAIFEIVAFCFGIFHHNNINFSPRFEAIVGKLIVMPSFHHVHHGREQQYTDSNYGFILSWWDRLFHTISVKNRPADFASGLDHHPEYPFLKLLYLPFTRKPVKEWE